MTSRLTTSRRPSLRDVADRAGVSVMTASNVVNDRRERVGEAARERVLQAIAELGYRPQKRGRALRLSREFAVGFVLLHPDRRFLDDPYTNQVAAGMSNALARRGYGLMVIGAQDLEDLGRKAESISHVDALAVIVSGRRPDRAAAYALLERLGLPMVYVQDLPVDQRDDTAYVLQDDVRGGEVLARRVLGAGARRLLVAVPRHVWPAVERRVEGILDVAEECGATAETVACPEEDVEAAAAAIVRRLTDGAAPDAIMGGNDQLGISAIRAAERVGRRVPDDLMVTGFNGFYFRSFSTPLLESVRSPAYEIGEETANRLVDRIESGSFADAGVCLPVSALRGASIPLSPSDAHGCDVLEPENAC